MKRVKSFGVSSFELGVSGFEFLVSSFWRSFEFRVSGFGLLLLIAGFVLGPLTPCPAYEYPGQVLVGNFARAIIMEDEGITTNETEVTVSIVTNFPTISATNEYYYLVFVRTSDNRKEIVKVTSVDTPTKTLTVVRAQDGTSALTFVRNDRVELWITAGLMDDHRAEQRGYTAELIADTYVDVASNTVAVSNLTVRADTVDTRLAGVVETGKLSIASFDVALFEKNVADNVSLKAGVLDLSYFASTVNSMKLWGNPTGVSGPPIEVDLLDEDGMVSDSSEAAVTQQSVKAYVDAVDTTGTFSAIETGYQIFPSGLIIQWGLSATISGDSGLTFSFPVTFPNAAFIATATLKDTSTAQNEPAHASITSTSEIHITNASSLSRQVYWTAIGY